MKWYEKQKKLYTQNQEEQKNTPFGDRASIRGNDAVDHAALSAAVQESLKSQNEQLQTGKNDEAESFKSKETTVIQEHTGRYEYGRQYHHTWCFHWKYQLWRRSDDQRQREGKYKL